MNGQASLHPTSAIRTGIVLIGLVLAGLPSFVASAQTTSPDAIALRVTANTGNLSARRWYESKGFKGSPQSLKVDGYEAVRDGRTVYVNAANVESGSLYANIYIISYNQAAERATTDIFGQLLQRWKFNTNLTTASFCRSSASKICLSDSDCGTGDFCLSLKSRVVRDTRRLSDLNEITAKLATYQAKQGHYPRLNSGTYLRLRTLSVWPSWQAALGSDLGGALPIDPVNELGVCPGYHPVTCWNEAAKVFFTNLPTLPGFSRSYQYASRDAMGASYQLCAVMESGMVSGPLACPTACTDFDGDGYGRPASSLCGYPALDCNDADPAIHPGATEICFNSLDDDCDGGTDCSDSACAYAQVCNVPCAADGCNANCPGGCTGAEDPDCVCANGNGCCGISCNPVNDGDCAATCTGTHPCDSTCDFGCNVSQDPDCGCLTGNACCGLSCTTASDAECTGACTDNDVDGYGDPGSPSCLSPETDCNDGFSSIHPNATEICDGHDNDCDGDIDEGCDDDNDNYCDCTMAFVFGSDLSAVCNLTNTTNAAAITNTCDCGDTNAAVNRGVAEICDNSTDDDCDGQTDCADSACMGAPVCAAPCAANGCNGDCPTGCTAAEDPDCACQNGNACCGIGCLPSNDTECLACADDDHDNYDTCDPSNPSDTDGQPIDCLDTNPAVNPGAAETCDNINNNCNSMTDEGCDDDGDNYCDRNLPFVISSTCPLTTSGAMGNDCDDSLINVRPGIPEICDNTIDDNCNSQIDCAEASCATASVCAALCSGGCNTICPTGCTVAQDPDCGCQSGNGCCAPGCTSAQDNDCTPPCVDSDTDGYDTCNPAQAGDTDGLAADCNDTLAFINPGATETCDDNDNNCNGTVDEGCDDDGDDYCDAIMAFYGFPVAVCPQTNVADGQPGNDCQDDGMNASLRNPGLTEICDDLIDNDCDGNIDEGCIPCCTFDLPPLPCRFCDGITGPLPSLPACDFDLICDPGETNASCPTDCP